MTEEMPVEMPVVEEEVVSPDHLVTWVINEVSDEVSDIETVSSSDEVSDTSVSVTFTCGTTGITHDRTVNTIGCEDAAAIEQRLSEVARGVHHKICAGAITEPTPEVIEDTVDQPIL